MSFSRFLIGFTGAFAVLAACGGESAAPAPENTVKKQAQPVESSPANSAAESAPAAPPEPSVEFANLPGIYKDADYSRGRRTFRLCSSCHLSEEGAGHLVGPNLYGLFGRKVGAAEGFAYSPALQEADFVWTPEQLDAWLAKPNAFLRGNRMSFAGVRREADRNAVIAYLMIETGWQPEP